MPGAISPSTLQNKDLHLMSDDFFKKLPTFLEIKSGPLKYTSAEEHLISGRLKCSIAQWIRKKESHKMIDINYDRLFFNISDNFHFIQVDFKVILFSSNLN